MLCEAIGALQRRKVAIDLADMDMRIKCLLRERGNDLGSGWGQVVSQLVV